MIKPRDRQRAARAFAKQTDLLAMDSTKREASFNRAVNGKRTPAERRVTARKSGGDDAYSWAVFVDGIRKWTGLHRSEVAYYKRIEVQRIEGAA